MFCCPLMDSLNGFGEVVSERASGMVSLAGMVPFAVTIKYFNNVWELGRVQVEQCVLLSFAGMVSFAVSCCQYKIFQ